MRAYSFRRRFAAAAIVTALVLPLSALIAFGMYPAAGLVLQSLGVFSCGSPAGNLPQQILNGFLIFIYLGLPVALLVAIPVTFFAISWLTSVGRFAFGDAARFGATIGVVIGVAELLLVNFLLPLPSALNPNTSSATWICGLQLTDDGLPTLFGFAVELLALPLSAALGLIAGLVARLVLGTPKPQPAT